MKTISKLQLVALGVGASLSTFSVIPAPTLAASLNYFGSDENLFFNKLIEVTNDPNITTYADVKEQLKIGEVQGKAGGTGKDLFFSKNGSNGPNPISSSSLSWNKNTTYNWTLDWNTETNQATFKVLNPNTPRGYNDLIYNYTTTYPYDNFNALGLITRADPGFGATMNLTIKGANFNDNTSQIFTSDNSVTSISGTNQFDKKFFLLSDLDQEITQVQGTFQMNWIGNTTLPKRNSTTANSHVAFQIMMFDPQDSASTPEPGVMLGLFSLGIFGTLKKRQKSN